MTPETSNKERFTQLEFYNQQDSFPWKLVGDRACGPTAAAMALSILKDDLEPVSKTSPLDVLEAISQIQKLPNEPINYYIELEHPHIPISRLKISVGHNMSVSLKEQIKDLQLHCLPHEGDQFIPIFTLNTGWDHRGSKRFFKTYGLKADKFGDINDKRSPETLTKELAKGSLIMASVLRKTTSHINLVVDYSKKEQKLLIYDPMEGCPEWKNLNKWLVNFRGYGTIIYPSLKNNL